MLVDTEPGIAIWDLRTIDTIESLYSRYIEHDMARNAYRNPKAVAEHLHRRLADEFMRAAQVYAVDVHPGDLEAHSEPYYVDHRPRKIKGGLYAVDMVGSHNGEPVPMGVLYEMRWRPKTLTALFQGGPMDGQYVDLNEVTLQHRAIDVEVITDVDFMGAEGVRTDKFTYDLTGWHERGRHWVFTPH